MKKSLMLCGLLLALTSSIASAAAGVSLRWNDCFGEADALQNRTSACLLNTGSQTIVGSFQLGADLTQTSGVEVVVDIATADATLPPWWQFKNAGSCRAASLTVNAVIPGAAINCVDWISGGGSGGLAAYALGAGGPNTSRIIIGFATPPPGLPDLVAGTDYFAFNAKIDNLKSTGTGNCGGCLSPACLVLNSILCATPPVIGVPSRDTKLSGPTNGTDSNYVTWQGGGGISSGRGNGCPAATPTHSSTWSSVKSLYR